MKYTAGGVKEAYDRADYSLIFLMTEQTAHSTKTLQPDQPVSRYFVVAVIITALLLLWFSAGDHSLYPPDEGRYGSVSLHMAQGGSWLVPVFEGHIHLTKPPLIYWLQALSIRVLGRTELAVRLPGLIASSFLILLLFRFARKQAGTRVALMAVAGLAVTPMFVLVSRLAVIDPLLDLFWFGVIAFGYQAITDTNRSTKYTLLMWISLAIGLFAKGPVALLPVGVLMIWVLLSETNSWKHCWKLWVGIPVAFIPLAVWAILVMKIHPDAWEVWKHELLDRTAGTGAHNKPIWFYIPILFAGFFPISALMPVPAWNVSLRYVWSQLRRGSLESLLYLAVFIPFLFFSMIPGKLMTYLMPMGPLLAILVALYLRDVTVGANQPERSAGRWFKRKPCSIRMLAVGVSALAIITVIIAYEVNSEYLWMTIPFIIAAVLSAILSVVWRRKASGCWGVLILLWIGASGLWLCIEESEDILLAQVGARQFVHRVQELETNPGEIATFGFNDPTMSFYLNQEIPEYSDSNEIVRTVMDQSRDDLLLIAGISRWDRLQRDHPETASRFIKLDTALASRNRTVYILKLRK